ncbi:hypothetical protein NQ317_010427, partial [Molorchus minor]
MNIKLMLSRHLLIFLALGVVKVDGIKCYICGENEESGTPCQNFETEKDNYAKECDPTDKGCKTETLGNNIVKRTCILNPFNQCITANHVVYCFCSTNLCNGNSSSIKFPTDDEDLLEGSGVKTRIHNNRKTQCNSKN